jgi:inner membrane protein
MDPITHALVGLATGSLSGGGGVLSNPLALGCLIGSVIPDADIIMQYWGDYVYLKHHRGASHSLLGMAAISVGVAFLIHLLFPGISYLSILLWTYIGCLTHVSLDIFNSYGAKLFWPFWDKKLGSGLMLSLDPFLIVIVTLVYLLRAVNPLYSIIGLFAFVVYILFRQFRKIRVRTLLTQWVDFPVKRLVLFPSMAGLFSWEFIAYGEEEIATGKCSMFAKKIKLRERMAQSESWVEELVMNTQLGRFFHEFTKEYHISFEEMENGKIRVTMTDLRYFVNNRYMHHGTIQFDKELNPEKELFHPYNMSRSAKVPA